MRYSVNQGTIKEWTERHGGKPAMVSGGILEIAFGGLERDEFEPLEWQEFFERFEQKRLAFVYDEEAPPGQAGEYAFIRRDRAEKEYSPAERHAPKDNMVEDLA